MHIYKHDHTSKSEREYIWQGARKVSPFHSDVIHVTSLAIVLNSVIAVTIKTPSQFSQEVLITQSVNLIAEDLEGRLMKGNYQFKILHH